MESKRSCFVQEKIKQLEFMIILRLSKMNYQQSKTLMLVYLGIISLKGFWIWSQLKISSVMDFSFQKLCSKVKKMSESYLASTKSKSSLFWTRSLIGLWSSMTMLKHLS